MLTRIQRWLKKRTLHPSNLSHERIVSISNAFLHLLQAALCVCLMRGPIWFCRSRGEDNGIPLIKFVFYHWMCFAARVLSDVALIAFVVGRLSRVGLVREQDVETYSSAACERLRESVIVATMMSGSSCFTVKQHMFLQAETSAVRSRHTNHRELLAGTTVVSNQNMAVPMDVDASVRGCNDKGRERDFLHTRGRRW